MHGEEQVLLPTRYLKLFVEEGGNVMLSTEVDRILVDKKKVKGVKLKDGEKLDADIVVSNGDVAFTYKYMLSDEDRPRAMDLYFNNVQYSNSLVVIYFGTKRRYLDSKLHHHNIILGKEYRSLLRDIFNKKKMPNGLSLYLHMPTITDESIAPEGCESFYVLSLVPHLDANINWEETGPRYREGVLEFLEKNYLPDLRSNIIASHHIDPVHFKQDLNSYKGAAFSIKPSLLQTGWSRPHNRSRFIEDLYFAGAGTHPGAGVPAVIASGKIVSELVGEKYGVRSPQIAEPDLAIW